MVQHPQIPIVIKPSPIHGRGVFTFTSIPKHTLLGVVVNSDREITSIGSMINHSSTPSTRMIYDYTTRCYWLISNRDIEKDEELTADYRYTPDFISKPDPMWN